MELMLLAFSSLLCRLFYTSNRRDPHSTPLMSITLVVMIAATIICIDPHAATAFNDVGIYPNEHDNADWLQQLVGDNTILDSALNVIFTYLEGTFGALVMFLSFLGAVFSAGIAIGCRSKKAALCALALLLISSGAFISRSMVSTTYKPVIYIYPDKITDVEVKLRYQGDLTVTYPAYDASIEGWRVTAHPNGKLINLADHKEYSYLFWEGELPTKYYAMPSEGFVVPGRETAAFLQDYLSRVGLTPAEYNEFIVYWYPQIKDYPYVQIALAGDEYDRSAPLEIVPKPESILRVFVYFKRLSEPIKIAPQRIRGFVREGFTVVEWGGTVIR